MADQFGAGGARVPEWWPLYFVEENFSMSDRRAELVFSMIEFFNGVGSQLLRIRVNENASEELVLPLDFQETQALAAEDVKDLVPALEYAPEEALTCLAAAAHHVCLLTPEGQERLRHLQPFLKETRVTVWLYNHPDAAVPFRGVKAATIGRLAVRVSSTRPLVQYMSYKCEKCGELSRVRFPNGICKPPTACGTDGCKSRKLTEQRTTAECSDVQRLKLQEGSGDDPAEEGRIPRIVDVDLTGALIDAARTGEEVIVVGIVKSINVDAEAGKAPGGGRNKGQFLLYVHAVSVTSCRKSGAEDEAGAAGAGPLAGSLRRASFGGGAAGAAAMPNAAAGGASVQFSSRDLEFVAKFSQETAGDTFRILVNSLCPAIYGHELVKAALLLSLLGGVRKFPDSQETVPVRGDIHVLIVGDPGLGKSQMLQAAASAAPRGLYVCGATLSSAGLTVSDPTSGEFALEAGAVVLADRGVCCVDEFDKMTTHHQALLEVMEQQSVSVAKAGISASVPARTTIVAASNPVGGSYNRSKTVSENLKISSAMLSRFDLTFILEDRRDEEHDALLTAHVMASHGAPGRAQGTRRALLEARQQGDGYLLEDAAAAAASAAGVPGAAPRAPLRQSLRQRPEDDSLPLQLLRKFIAYARAYCFPRLLPEAHIVLRTFFLELRTRAGAGDTLPVTARQLESLIRLAEARARCELRSEVTAADASDAVELMKESLFDSLQNQYGFTDFGRSGGRSTGNKETKRFLGKLEQLAKEKGDPFFNIANLVTIADDMALNVRDVHDFIEKLNDMGDILKHGTKYRLRCSEWGPSQAMPENNGSNYGGGGGTQSQQARGGSGGGATQQAKGYRNYGK